MLRTSLGYTLVRTFPECAIVLVVGCYFLNLKISKITLLKKTLMLGVIQTCMALCKIFLCLILSEVIYISLITNILSIPRGILVDNYSVMSAIYTLPSLIIFAILAFIMEFINRRFQEGNRVNHNE